jgi:hypothetical protein
MQEDLGELRERTTQFSRREFTNCLLECAQVLTVKNTMKVLDAIMHESTEVSADATSRHL